MKKIVRIVSALILSLLIISAGTSTSAQGPIQRYADKYRVLAGKLAMEFGIPRAIIVGVAIIESSSGQARNCRDLNNHFGIVGKNNIPRQTRYKQYDSEEESFRDFCRVISHKSFYASLRGNTNLNSWARAISEAGYSEKPNVWRERVVDIMQTHRL